MWPIAKDEPLGIVPDVQPEGSYFWDGAQMSTYHGKALLSEGVRYNARRISWRWAVLRRTAHCRDNSLAEVDDPLSQQKQTL